MKLKWKRHQLFCGVSTACLQENYKMQGYEKRQIFRRINETDPHD